jgi:GNAT superfamily N-acetyltransferase
LYEPRQAHYYLGVLGVHPVKQGTGAGRMLIDAYCKLSDQDPLSSGTFLETAEEGNLVFYQHCRFELVGNASLDKDVVLYCLFRPRLIAS